MFSPRLIFLSLWSLQIIFHLIFSSEFNPFLAQTWMTVSFGVGAFVFGTFFVDWFMPQEKLLSQPLGSSYSIDTQSLAKYFIALYPLWVLYALSAIYFLILKMDMVHENLQDFRNIVVYDFNHYRFLTRWMRVFYLGVGASIFFIANAKWLTKKQLFIILFLGFIAALLTSGRLYLLLYFLAVIALLYRSKLISFKGVFIGAIGFIFLFVFIALMLGKGSDSGINSLVAKVTWNINIYFLSSLSCFNEYIAIGSPPIPGGAILPNALRTIFLDLGIAIPLRPTLNPFLYVPVPCNTYTFLFPLFHDGGFFGVLIGGLLMGIVQQFLYLKFKLGNSPSWHYLYAISLYGMFMTIFEDPYFSSPGFWLQLLLPVFVFYIYRRRSFIMRYFGEKISK
jgi:oligosaccharide repeat unit polymerase